MLDSIGIAQHHDAVTGTSPSPTVMDYHARFSKAQFTNSKLWGQAIGLLHGGLIRPDMSW